MRKKLSIGFDLDGVIIDHASNKLRCARELGYALEPRDTASGILKSRVDLAHYREIQRFIYGSATLDAPPMDGALETIRTLAPLYDLSIISRRNTADGGDVLGFQWLERHGVLSIIPRERVAFVPHHTVGAKNEIAKKWSVALYLDDQLKILHELSSVKTRVFFDPFDVEAILPMVNLGELSTQFTAKVKPWQIIKIKKWQELPALVSKILQLID